MRYEQLIGLRYLRSRKRDSISLITLISIAGVALGVWALLVVLSVMSGFEEDLRAKILGTHAHVLVEGQGFRMENPPGLLETITAPADVVDASPFLKGEVMITSSTNLSTVELKGVLPEYAAAVNNLEHDLVEGSLEYLESPSLIPSRHQPQHGENGREAGDKPLSPAEQPAHTASADPPPVFEMPPLPQPDQGQVLPPIVIGQELKRNLLVSMGDELTVVSPLGDLGPTGPTPKARTFQVAGVFYTGMYEYDTKVTYTSMGAAQDFFDAGREISGVEVRVRNVDRTGPVTSQLEDSLQGTYRVRDWRELNRSLFAALKLEKIAMFIILTFIVLVASFTIVSNLIMMVLEKAREIAILKSMGATNRSVMSIFVTEGLIIGAIGMVLGLFMGLGTCAIISRYGIPLDPEVYYISSLPVQVDPVEVFLVCVAAILISFLATIYPSVQAARLEPVEGLRYE